jgi:hypothetical protein
MLTMALAFVMALAAQTRMLLPVVATVVVVQALIATAPSPADARGRAIPTPQLVATLTGGLLAAVIAYRPDLLIGALGTRVGIDGLATTGVLAGLAPSVAMGVLVAIVAQIVRTDGRRELVASLGTVVSLVLFAATASAWIGAARTPSGREIVIIAATAIVVALVVWIVFGFRWIGGVIAVLTGGVAAAGMALRLGGAASWEFAAVAGIGVAGFAVVGLLVGMAWTEGRHHLSAGWGFPGALAFALTGPLVYVCSQMVSAAL